MRFFANGVDTWYIKYREIGWNANKKVQSITVAKQTPATTVPAPTSHYLLSTAPESLVSTFRLLAKHMDALPVPQASKHRRANDKFISLFAKRERSPAPSSIICGQCLISSGLLPRSRGGSPRTKTAALSASSARCIPPLPPRKVYKSETDWICSVHGFSRAGEMVSVSC